MLKEDIEEARLNATVCKRFGFSIRKYVSNHFIGNIDRAVSEMGWMYK